MAKKDKAKEKKALNRSIQRNLDLLQSNIDSLYSDTYFNTVEDKNNAQNIKNSIDASIDELMTSTYSDTSIGNISRLYTRAALNNAKADKSVVDALQMFNDSNITDNILSSWMNNKWIKDLDYEIDLVLKYIPKLKEALVCKRDLVLSADHFAKEFATFHNFIYGATEKELFGKRMEELKVLYRLPECYEKWYDTAQTYGECFIYISPYNKEFKKLLQNKANTNPNSSTITPGFSESSTIQLIKGSSTLPGTDILIESANNAPRDIVDAANKLNISGLSITINESIIPTCVMEEYEKMDKMTTRLRPSASQIFRENVEYLAEAKGAGQKFEKLIPDDLEMPKELDGTSSEMLVTSNPTGTNVNVPGCVVKEIPHENVLPQYIDKVCLGYYIFEFKSSNALYDDQNAFDYSTGTNTIGSSSRMSANIDNANNDAQHRVLDYIAGQLTNAIDAKFINANQDLKKEIYMILKHNEIFNSTGSRVNGNITVSFVPAEDMIHMKFNTDERTQRGVSDLAYSIFPAKLYACLYICDVLGRLTRGQDKRVYYVKQNVETNTSKTLLNVLNQIKRGNFGARQMENLSNILNITGRFNDYLIPLSPNGDSPIQFDIMPGQQFTDNSDLMQALEKMAIDATDIPYDLIEARQSLDYAIQATMTNSKVMRNTYKRQDLTEDFFSQITTKIYNYQYNESEQVKVSLPAPSFLNVSNTAQLIDGTLQFVDKIAEVELAGEPEGVIAEFKKEAIRYYMPSHINLNMINQMKRKAILNYQKNNITTGEE